MTPNQEPVQGETAPVPDIPEDLQVYYDGAHRLLGADAIGSITFYNGLVVRLIERIAQAEQRAAKAEAENAQWRTWGIVEIAVRNPSVAEYVAHLEERATKAEQQVRVLSASVSDEEIETASKDDWATKRLSVGGFNSVMRARVSATRKESKR